MLITLPLWAVVLMCLSGPATWLAMTWGPRLWRRAFPQTHSIRIPFGLSAGETIRWSTWGNTWALRILGRAGKEVPGSRCVTERSANCFAEAMESFARLGLNNDGTQPGKAAS